METLVFVDGCWASMKCYNALRGEQVNRRSLFMCALSLLLAVGFFGARGDVALGHAHLDASVPAEGATVAEWPETVTLTFSESIEVRSSVFKVYPLDTDGVTDSSQLNAEARTLYENVLPLRRDEEDRVDVGIVPAGATSTAIQIVLQDDARPGAYVVMWRVLSVDTHVVSGFSVFTYAPDSVD